MTTRSARRNTVIALVVLLLLCVFLLLRCSPEEPAVPGPSPAAVVPPAQPQTPRGDAPPAQEPDEVLTPATLQVPEQVAAGALLAVAWTGPDNRGDYLTIVQAAAPPETVGPYQETKYGPSLELTAPIDPGTYEVRYATGRSHTVLGRAPLEVVAAGATLEAVAEIVIGSKLSVTWTGPDNRGDYITLVPLATPDGQYGNYTPTERGSPLSVTAPTLAGEAELRYMTGQGNRVLARRPVRIVEAQVALSAPDQAVAGSRIQVTWTGPDNDGDFITLVEAGTPDGKYGNYADTRNGSPLPVLTPIMSGEAELRYMTTQGYRVLARRPIRIVAAEVSLSAPDEVAASSDVEVTWTGPDNDGDYITVVAKGTPDGQYGSYGNTSAGSPLSLKAPEEAGEAELRYVTGQGGKVLARRPLRIVP